MISGGRKGTDLLFLNECFFWNHKCTIFSPFSVKIYTYIRFLGFQGGTAPLPKNLVFGGLNLHKFRPFFSLTFYKNIGFFGGEGSMILQPPLNILRGLSPPPGS